LERRKAALGRPFRSGVLNTPSGAPQILNVLSPGLSQPSKVEVARQLVYEKQNPCYNFVSCPIDPRFMMALQQRRHEFGAIQAEAWGPSPADPELQEFFYLKRP
jgi:hypothetical protein